MKKIALTIAIAFMAFAANAQRESVGYKFESYEDNNIFENYGDLHRVSSYGDYHYVGSHYYNSDENEDIFTRIGIFSSSTSYGLEDYSYDGLGNYSGGGLLGRGPQRESLFCGGGVFSPNIPSHGTHEDTDAPLGGGALLLIGFGAAYAMSKKNRK